MTPSAEAPAPSVGAEPSGWGRVTAALAAAAIASAVAIWPPSLALPAVVVEWLFPIPSLIGLVAAGLAGCAVAAWARGGRLGVAVVAIAVMVSWAVRGPADGIVRSLTHGWALLVAAGFGAACLVPGRATLLARALPAVIGVGVFALAVLAWRGGAPGAGVSVTGEAYAAELDARRGAALAAWQQRTESAVWQGTVRRVPVMQAWGDRSAQWLAARTPPVRLVPALLVLETLLALALAWVLWHRLERTRLGAPLAPLAMFRFNDQMVWGVIAGAVLILLPSLDAWATVGLNVLVVCGALYALRGVGVLQWWGVARWWWSGVALAVCSIPFVGPVPGPAVVATVAMLIGLGDTWRDFRGIAPSMAGMVRL